MKAGCQSTDFNASSLQNGVYYYRAILTGIKKELTLSGKTTMINKIEQTFSKAKRLMLSAVFYYQAIINKL